MVHFLRTEKNKTIIECSVDKGDLSSDIILEEYSLLLLNSEYEQRRNLIWDFVELHEIRRIWFEGEEEFGEWKSLNDFVSTQYTRIAKKYNLNYTND